MHGCMISRKEVLELIGDHWIKRKGTENPFDWEVCNELQDILEAVERFDSVLFESVRHGEWVVGEYTYLCSECGQRAKYAKFKYCPNCGAKMNGGENAEKDES